ncbi:MAG TPA: hypothetical protein VEC37_13150 [Bacillota bacterium]|nr:hypothetical protein [Bacillota bacterium]
MQVEFNGQNQAISYGKFLSTSGRAKVEIDKNDVKVKINISTEGLNALKQTFTKDLNADIIQKEATRLNWLPEYSGIYETDKAIATSVENCTKEEQGYVYDIIRENFLIKDSNSMTEEERQANISFGMKKAELVANTFIPEEQRQNFLNAMDIIAKLATAGKSDSEGQMDYGINTVKYLGSGSNLIQTTDTEDIMKKYASEEYKQYQSLMDKFGQTGNTEDAVAAMRYHLNWFIDAIKAKPNLVKLYEERNQEYISAVVKNPGK